MRVEEEHEDVLQDMEFAVAETYRHVPTMSDYDVIRTYEALKDHYSAEQIGRPPRDFLLSPLERQLLDDIRRMCEWRLGRAAPPAQLPRKDPDNTKLITVDVVILCLKRLIKSAQRWDKDSGPQGYLDFMSEYV